MNLPLTNKPTVVQEWAQYLRGGIARCEMLIFRMINGAGKVLLISDFASKYAKQYPDLVREILRRAKRLEENETVYVWAEPEGRYDMSVLKWIPKGAHQKLIISGAGGKK